jgi:NAD-dependent SIR2 family protein deacetylase
VHTAEHESLDHALATAAQLLATADGLVISAGAGMGVDSGLPDFRGKQGFWRAYPALGQRGLAFEDVASPAAFDGDPRLAWGFYGHRLTLYRNTPPHAGFGILQRLAARLPRGAFIFTSNVDGHFQKAGFPAERIAECHGSIHFLQCHGPCSPTIWSAADFHPVVDAAACRLESELPRCPDCDGLARPNILMFGDGGWIATRSDAQTQRLREWLRTVRQPVIVEIGAGTAVATVRYFSERLARPLIRINPGDSDLGRARGVALPCNALAALERIEMQLAG